MIDGQDEPAKTKPMAEARGVCSRLSCPLTALLAGARLEVEIAAIGKGPCDTPLIEDGLSLSIRARRTDEDKSDGSDCATPPSSPSTLRFKLAIDAGEGPIEVGPYPGQERKEGEEDDRRPPRLAEPLRPRGGRLGSRELQREKGIIAFADLVIDVSGRRVWRAGRAITLTKIEFELLHVLSRVPGTVLSRAELIAGAWPERVHVEPRTVTIHVGHLRKRLMRHGACDLIRTVRGAGYAMEAPTNRRASDGETQASGKAPQTGQG